MNFSFKITTKIHPCSHRTGGHFWPALGRASASCHSAAAVRVPGRHRGFQAQPAGGGCEPDSLAQAAELTSLGLSLGQIRFQFDGQIINETDAPTCHPPGCYRRPFFWASGPARWLPEEPRSLGAGRQAPPGPASIFLQSLQELCQKVSSVSQLRSLHGESIAEAQIGEFYSPFTGFLVEDFLLWSLKQSLL